jgi:hypothetical protein
MTNKEPNFDDLDDFMTEEILDKVDAIKFLKAFGVDTNSFFEAVDKTVQRGHSHQLRQLAEEEKAASSQGSKFLIQLAGMSRQAMLGMFERVSQGKFGKEYQELALVRCRNKKPTDFSDEELRTWLEDICEILGEQIE